MKNGKKIGILGGTFNPIHCGHLYLAESAMKAASLDEVLFIPSGVSYMKDQREILSPVDRMEMVKLAISNYPNFNTSSIEINKAGNSYSYETILELKEQYHDVDFFFLTGADTLFSIESWKNPDVIFREAAILAAYRVGVSLEALQQQIIYLQKKYAADISLTAVTHVDISSTDIRHLVKNGASIKGLVPFEVEHYIKQHCFYK